MKRMSESPQIGVRKIRKSMDDKENLESPWTGEAVMKVLGLGREVRKSLE